MQSKNQRPTNRTGKEGEMGSIIRPGITAMAVIFCIIFILMYGCGEQKGSVSQSPPQSSNKQVITITEKPVKVTMKLLDQYKNHYQFELNVIYGKERFRFETEMAGIENSNQAIALQRSRTGWKGPYFFVGWDRGGGNASRGFLDLVFTLRDEQLVYIGETLAGEVDEPGGSYKEGAFRDIYDKFENNELTSHAEAPLFSLVLEEKDGRFQVNLSRTWEENSTMKTRGAEDILYNAVLAKYCQRKAELEEKIQAAKSMFDKEEFAKFMNILSQVVPGELPERSVNVLKERLP
jgi:hypothetical protein